MAPITLDENMKLVVVRVESHYLMLIYKYITKHFITDYLYSDLFFGLEYYANKCADIYAGLQCHGSFIFPAEGLNQEKGEQIVFFDFLANFCFTPADSTIETYTIKPDQKNGNKIFAEKERLCKTLRWAIGHLIKLSAEVVTMMKITADDQVPQTTQIKN